MTIQFDFRDRGVFVSDSATGLGRQIAAAFHALGARVAIHGARADEVNTAVRELGAGPRLVAAPGELSKVSGIAMLVEGAVSALGRLDVLVCLGTKASLREVERMDSAYFEQVIGENVKQLFFLSQACVPALRRSKGAVVHVASSVGQVGGPKGAVGYATASGAVVQMARMMAIELAVDGVRVNALCPGWSGFSDTAAAAAFGEFFTTRAPLHRAQTPEEIAAAVLYLAAPFSGYTTGTALVVDGGLASGHYVG